MTIGTILIQPQRVRRAAGVRGDEALIDDLLSTLARLLADPERGAAVFAACGAAVTALAERIRQQAPDGLARALARLQTPVQPLIAAAREISQTSLESAADGLTLAHRLLSALETLANDLTLDRLRDYVGLIVDILHTDLGLTAGFIQGQIWALIDDLINRLEQMPQPADPVARANLLGTAALLRRLKRRFQGEFTFPELDIEQIARLLLDELRKSGIASIAQRVACTTGKLDDLLEVETTITQIVPLPGAPQDSIGAASVAAPSKYTYLWYASWLLADDDFVWFGPDDFKKADQLAAAWKAGTTPLAQFLREQFSPPTRALLDSYTSGDPSAELQTALLDDLNRIITGPSIYGDNRFAGVTLKDETRALRDRGPHGEERLRLNRMLLEDAYPDMITRQTRSIPGKVWDYLWNEVKDWAGWPDDRAAIGAGYPLGGDRLLLGDTTLFKGEITAWDQTPLFDERAERDELKYYSFVHIPPGFLEGWAWHSAWICDAYDFILHLTAIQPGHQITSVLNGAYSLTHGIVKLAARKPYSGFNFSSSFLNTLFTLLQARIVTPLLLTTIGSIQGRYTEANFENQFMFWLTNWLSDAQIHLKDQEIPVVDISLADLREMSLAFMTLYNFRGPQDGPSTLPERPAENHQHIQPFVDLFVDLASKILVHQVDRKDYVNPIKMPGNVAALWLLGGLGMGLVGGFVGTFVGQCIAWAEDWEQLGLTLLKSMWKIWFSFWPDLYDAREGDTDDGKFNAKGAPFRGYPKKKKDDGTATPSPYLLPYESGKSRVVGQGNAGMWSHNVIFNPSPSQTYAYDFGLDQAEEILASRPGTVVSFSESTPDNTGGTWNNIVIRHDVDDNGNLITPDPNHDLDIGGRLVVTFAQYGHGRQNGVTAAFALHNPPVPTANIVGTRVKRGMPIMLAGDTGISFHNHLHMHVLPEQLPAGASGPTAPASNATRNTAYTIPFIFQDVGDEDDDGVCKHSKWYTATNQRRLS